MWLTTNCFAYCVEYSHIHVTHNWRSRFWTYQLAYASTMLFLPFDPLVNTYWYSFCMYHARTTSAARVLTKSVLDVHPVEMLPPPANIFEIAAYLCANSHPGALPYLSNCCVDLLSFFLCRGRECCWLALLTSVAYSHVFAAHKPYLPPFTVWGFTVLILGSRHTEWSNTIPLLHKRGCVRTLTVFLIHHLSLAASAIWNPPILGLCN